MTFFHLLMMILAFSPAVSSRNIEPWPGLPGQTILILNVFLGGPPPHFGLQQSPHFCRPFSVEEREVLAWTGDPLVQSEAHPQLPELWSVDELPHTVRAADLGSRSEVYCAGPKVSKKD